MNVHEVKSIETKSILSRLKSKDNYWGIAYNMNCIEGANMVAFIVIHVVLAMVLVIFLISL